MGNGGDRDGGAAGAGSVPNSGGRSGTGSGASRFGAVREQVLDAACVDEALVLSRAANWNQNAADWGLFFAHGRVWGLRVTDGAGAAGGVAGRGGRLVASAAILPYGKDFGWLSMVLVLPEFRRGGFATRLLGRALESLREQGRIAVLDATPDGQPVYRRLGFVDTWGFARWRREALAPGVRDDSGAAARRCGGDEGRQAVEPAGAVASAGAGRTAARPVAASDWGAILVRDAAVFGAGRGWLLRSLYQRRPALAHVLDGAGDATPRGSVPGPVRGYVFGREGREATQIGPVVAASADDAALLIEAALARISGAVYVDLTDRHRALEPWLAARGFARQRPFTRMVLGALEAPGEATDLVVVAGPELG